MTYKALSEEAVCFRKAIEVAKEAGEFKRQGRGYECMDGFPVDCCDVTADLFTHYLYHQHGVDSIRVDSRYYDEFRRFTCGHSWQEVGRWLVDLTGDQFYDDPSLPIKAAPIYISARWMTSTSSSRL